MTSQISQDKNSPSLFKLMKEDFRNRRWMLVLSLVMEVLLGPLVMLFSVTTERMNEKYYYIYDANPDVVIESGLRRAVNRGYQSNFVMFGAIIAVVGAVIVSVVGFRHLYSKRKMDLYGSIPVSRQLQFLATYINGVLIYLFPLLVNIVLTYIVAVASLGKYGEAIVYLKISLEYLWKLLLIFMSVYNLCLVAVMLSGNAFAAIVNAIIMGVLVIAFYFVIITRMQISFETFYLVDDSIFLDFAWLSPLALPFLINIPDFSESANYGVYIALSATFMVVLFFISAALHKFRKAELAEGGVTNKVYLYAIRILASICGALFMPEVFDIFLGGTYAGWQIFSIALGGVAVFGIANMILYKSGRAFFRDVFVMIGSMIVAIAIFCGMRFNTYYDRYIPNRDSIESVEVFIDNFHDESMFYTVIDGEVKRRNANELEMGKLMEKTVITDKDLALAILKMGVKNVDDDHVGRYSNYEPEVTDFTIKDEAVYEDSVEYSKAVYSDEEYWGYESGMMVRVHLTGGRVYTRRYEVYTDDLDIIRPIVESDGYMQEMYPMISGNMPLPCSINFNMESGYTGYKSGYLSDKKKIDEVYAALRADFANANSVYNFSQGAYRSSYATVTFEYQNSDSNLPNGRSNPMYITTRIPDSYENTIEVFMKYAGMREDM